MCCVCSIMLVFTKRCYCVATTTAVMTTATAPVRVIGGGISRVCSGAGAKNHHHLVLNYAHLAWKMFYIFFALLYLSKRVPITMRYTLYYYYNWVRIGRTGEACGYDIFLHTVLDVIFFSFGALKRHKTSAVTASSYSIRFGALRHVRNVQAPVTVTRGPMARKK
jgi:hypothetical protein